MTSMFTALRTVNPPAVPNPPCETFFNYGRLDCIMGSSEGRQAENYVEK